MEILCRPFSKIGQLLVSDWVLPSLMSSSGRSELTAAHMLTKRVLRPRYRGRQRGRGIVEPDAGRRFDIGGLRFFTKVKPVAWFEILGKDDFRRLARAASAASSTTTQCGHER